MQEKEFLPIILISLILINYLEKKDLNMKDFSKIRIEGARQNNLDNISLEIPKYQWITVCGVSGSGKSSLVHDVIYAQAQHDFLESINTYARRSFPKISSVDCDSIQGLSPSIVIDQNTFPNTPRSTIGTYTDIYTHIRLLYSRAGRPQYNASAFSFNSPEGVCEYCNGLGESMEVDVTALLDLNKSLNEGAIRHKTWKVGSRYWNIIKAIERFDMDKPVKDFSKEELDLLLYSPPFVYKEKNQKNIQTFSYEGIVSRMKKRMNDERGLSSATYDIQFFTSGRCEVCGGSRINKKAREVRLSSGYTICDMVEMELSDLYSVLENIHGTVEDHIIPVILKNLKNLIDVGVGYLTLNRSAATLSGGEAHKVKLARQLGNSLSDMIYILDEPTAGLHARDIDKIITICHEIADKHNTLIVIDHNLQMLKAADYMIDIGPGSGKNGGRIMAKGETVEVLKNKNSVTSNSIHRLHPIAKQKCRKAHSHLEIKGLTKRNFREFSVDIPMGIFTVITGASGAGKSTLLEEVLVRLPEATIVGQGNIGQNARGNIGTYSKLFDKIRKYYAKKTETDASVFSFNSEGACPCCGGLGYIVTDMHFMGDIRSSCEECGGKRYKTEVLELKVRNRSITDILDMTIEEARKWFKDEDDILAILEDIHDVGLGYITIGQPLNTLSGGEMQRLKLSSKLRGKRGIFLIDEPTKGLHIKDIIALINMLNKMVDNGNTVIVVEHNMDVICQSDWIIDLGPEGGKRGGEIIFTGTPYEMYTCGSSSYTAQYLKKYIDQYRGGNE